MNQFQFGSLHFYLHIHPGSQDTLLSPHGVEAGMLLTLLDNVLSHQPEVQGVEDGK